ncbi:MAG TPA: aminotransferase class IV [Prolixibacteraceae bacterium]|nr:aminotransferase class IV [Prolixibacteraceae bacterium]
MNKLIITDKGIIHSELRKETDLNKDKSVYEVLRVLDGTALFLEDHFNRLLSSVQMSGMNFKMNYSEFEHHIQELCTFNHQWVGNVKFVLSGDKMESSWSFSFIPHIYPSDAEYRDGVATGLLIAERANPNAKIIQQTVRDKANQMMAEMKLYEVLLVDRNGLVTEGSRSNVFFVKGDRFYTAPTAMVLAGVTRMKVLECLQELKFIVQEQAVASAEIGQYDAVFLTGTSPKVLPINRIDDQRFKAGNPMVEQLRIKYNSMIESYMASKKH